MNDNSFFDSKLDGIVRSVQPVITLSLISKQQQGISDDTQEKRVRSLDTPRFNRIIGEFSKSLNPYITRVKNLQVRWRGIYV